MTNTFIVQSQFISASRNIHNINFHKNIFVNVKCELLCFSFHVPSGIIFGVRMTQTHDTCKPRVLSQGIAPSS
jgi:hypothetical protein